VPNPGCLFMELWQEGSQKVQLSQTVEEGEKGEKEKEEEERSEEKGEASSETG
jgi:hypothetical protein